MIQILAILGILGGILCAIADCLLDIKGVDNYKVGGSKYIESAWENISPRRFFWSIILATFAVPMYSCGFIALMLCLHDTHPTLSITLSIVFLVGAMGGFMIHTILCLVPTIYLTITKKSGFDLAEEVLERMLKQIMFPFVTLYTATVIVPAIAVMTFIIFGILPLPLWCIVLNPIVFQIIGLLLRATKCSLFVDVPSIFAASLGIGMYGVLALMML